MEPWIGLRLPPDQLFLELRRQIAKGSMRGRLDLEKLEEGHIGWRQDAPTTLPFSVDDDFTLGVKWPTFWQYLEHLPHTRFVITVRDPVDVVLSFARQSGSLRDGLDYDVPFNAAMNDELASATDDVELRRVLLYEYINSRLLPHLDRPNVFVVRYERWHRDPEQLIDDLSRFLEVDRLQLTVQIERAGPSEADRRTLDLVSTHAPSARALGYVL